MKRLPRFFLLLFPLFLCFCVHAEMNLDEIEKQLMAGGLQGAVHGSNTDSGVHVLTYRNPTNFFESLQFPLISEIASVQSQIQKIKRHQVYLVKGQFASNNAPIKHINVTSLELIQDYSSDVDHSAYQYKGDLNDLKKGNEFVGRVHAQAEGGKVLVMEYKDQVVPVFVKEAATQAIVKTLYRGDLVKLRYKVRQEPDQPMHIQPLTVAELTDGKKPVELLESLVALHGQSVQKQGALIQFPKSPQINFDVYAVLAEDPGGTSIQYTIVNFEDQALFAKVREKLEKVWKANVATAENDRNKLVNRKLIVKIKGTHNMVDTGQANPQILIKALEDIEITVNK